MPQVGGISPYSDMKKQLQAQRRFVARMKRWSILLIALALVSFVLATFAAADATKVQSAGFALNDRGMWLSTSAHDPFSMEIHHRIAMLQEHSGDEPAPIEWTPEVLGHCKALEALDADRMVGYFKDSALIFSQKDDTIESERLPYLVGIPNQRAHGVVRVDMADWLAHLKAQEDAKSATAEAEPESDAAPAKAESDADATDNAAPSADLAEAEKAESLEPASDASKPAEAQHEGSEQRVLSAWMSEGNLHLRIAGEAEIATLALPIDLPKGRIQLMGLVYENERAHLQIIVLPSLKNDELSDEAKAQGELFDLTFKLKVLARDAVDEFLTAQESAGAGPSAASESASAAEDSSTNDESKPSDAADAPAEAGDQPAAPSEGAAQAIASGVAASAEPESRISAEGAWFCVAFDLHIESLASGVDAAVSLSDGEQAAVLYRVGDESEIEGTTFIRVTAPTGELGSAWELKDKRIWPAVSLGNRYELIAMHKGQLFTLGIDSSGTLAQVSSADILSDRIGAWKSVGEWRLHSGFHLLSQLTLYVFAAMFFCGAMLCFVIVAVNRERPSDQTLMRLTTALKARENQPGKPISLRELGIPHWAPLNARMLAFLIDFLLLSPIVIVAAEFSDINLESALTLFPLSTEYMLEGLRDRMATLALIGLYAFFCEAIWGRTLGKMIMRIRVVNLESEPPGELRLFARNLLRTLELCHMLTILVTLISIMLTRRNQRLGDLITGTALMVELPEEKDGSDESSF